jgi:hypothetical protein
MLVALIFICNPGIAEECDASNAIKQMQVPGLYKTNEECHRGAIGYLHSIDVGAFLEPNKSYQITVSCREDRI